MGEPHPVKGINPGGGTKPRDPTQWGGPKLVEGPNLVGNQTWWGRQTREGGKPERGQTREGGGKPRGTKPGRGTRLSVMTKSSAMTKSGAETTLGICSLKEKAKHDPGTTAMPIGHTPRKAPGGMSQPMLLSVFNCPCRSILNTMRLENSQNRAWDRCHAHLPHPQRA